MLSNLLLVHFDLPTAINLAERDGIPTIILPSIYIQLKLTLLNGDVFAAVFYWGGGVELELQEMYSK